VSSELFKQLTKRPEWQRWAACRGVGWETMFPAPSNVKAMARARALCEACAVEQECRDYAVGHEETMGGVWGGLSERQILQLRRDRRRGEAA